MLFILFDIEIVFLYPLAVILHRLAWFGFVEFLFFIVILALAYVYIWRKGALECGRPAEAARRLRADSPSGSCGRQGPGKFEQESATSSSGSG